MPPIVVPAPEPVDPPPACWAQLAPTTRAAVLAVMAIDGVRPGWPT